MTGFVFKETSLFTRAIRGLMTDDEYRELQHELILRPDAGALMAGTGGLRKLRWSLKGRGKRGGCRVIYYWAVSESQIFMLLAYPKNARDDLTDEQAKILRQLVNEEFGDG